MLLAGSALAADWLYVPNAYTDTAGKTWGTISDGNWTLCVTASGNNLTTKGEGNKSAVPPFAVAGTGECDLSKPIFDADGTRYRLVAQRQSPFWKFNKTQHGDRTITKYVASRDYATMAAHVCNEATELGEAVIDAPLLQYIGKRAFFKCSSLTNLHLNIPYAKYLAFDMTKGAENSNIASCAAHWRLDSVTNIQPRVFYGLSISGAIYLPSAAYVDHQAFFSCKSLKGLVLGSENPTGSGLVHIGANSKGMAWGKIASDEELESENNIILNGYTNDHGKISVAWGAALDFLVIGKGDAVKLEDHAFSGIYQITNVFFCGDRPEFGTTVFRNLNEKYAAFYIPPGNETWQSVIDAAIEPTDAERAEFNAWHAPGELIGMVNSQTHLGGNANRKQFLAYGNYRCYLNDIVVAGLPAGMTLEKNPDLYWDCIRTVRDVPVDADYVLSAPAPYEENGVFHYVSGYTLETATLTGWSDPVRQSGAQYVRSAGTRGSVRVTWIWETSTVRTGDIASLDDCTWEGDAVEITAADGTVIEPGSYVPGGLITLTPICANQEGFPKGGFERWENLPEGAQVDEDGRVTFMFDGTQRAIRALFRHDWVYDSEAKMIWNRRYRLNVTDIGNGKLAIGVDNAQSGSNGAFGNAFITDVEPMEAGGHLDFNGRITDANGQGEWTISQIGYRSLSPWSKVAADNRVSKHYPTYVRLPETLATLVGATFVTDGWDSTPLTNIVLATPLLAEVKNGFAQGHRKLYCMHVDCPALETIGQNFLNCGTDNLKFTDVSKWNLPLVKEIATQAFGNNCRYPNVKGTLNLPRLEKLGTQGLSPFTGVDTMILGTNGCTLTDIGKQAFFNCTALAKLVIGAKSDITFVAGGDYLPADTKLKVIEFPENKVPSNLGTVLDTLLSYKNTQSGPDSYVSVYGSMKSLSGVLAQVAASPMTDEEKAASPSGKEVFGIYVTGDTKERKAYLIDNGYVPYGSKIILR